MAILAIFGLIAISGFYLGEIVLKIIGLGVSVPVGILKPNFKDAEQKDWFFTEYRTHSKDIAMVIGP